MLCTLRMPESSGLRFDDVLVMWFAPGWGDAGTDCQKGSGLRAELGDLAYEESGCQRSTPQASRQLLTFAGLRSSMTLAIRSRIDSDTQSSGG